MVTVRFRPHPVVVRDMPTLEPYDSFEVEENTVDEALSDGVPEPLGDGGDSEKILPPPIGVALSEIDKTARSTR